VVALGAGETSKAWRAFRRCRALAAEVTVERRPAAALAADLFLAETTLRVGQVEDAVVHQQLRELIEAARESGAWTQSGCEALRLRALLLRWQTAPSRGSRRDLPAEDRDWLLRDDFFAIAPDRLRPLAGAARMLRFRLARGSDRELAMLRELVRAEEEAATAEELSADEARWRARGLEALASYHAERRNFDRAQIYVDRMPRDQSRILRALLLLQREDHGQAEEIARELVTAGEDVGLQLLAEALEASGRPAAALPFYDRAVAVAADDAAMAAAQNGRGDCLLGLDRLAEAGAAYEAALKACGGDEVGLLAEHAETCKDLGRLAERQGDPAAALARYLEALARGEEARKRLLRDPFGASWLDMHSDQTTAIDGVLRTWVAAGGDPWQVLHALELGRARGALDLAAGGTEVVDADRLRALIERRLMAGDVASVASVAAEIEALRAHHASATAPPEVPSPAELRAFAVRHGEVTLLSWWLGVEQAWLLVVRGDDVRQFRLADAATCRRHVAAAARAVASPRGEAAALRAAADCLLPEAVRPSLGREVLAVPDPRMGRLPCAALVVDGRPLGVGVRLMQAPSLAVAMLLGERRAAGSGALVVAAPPRTDLADRLGLDVLEYVAEERAAVMASHGGRPLSGADATLANLRAALAADAPAVLHVAAHAIDCPGLPTQSLLLLADGPLAMGGVGSVSLRGSLVVLSACAAAAGEQRGHEGVVGLVEGLFAAGARAVVAPVAPVNQQATADFMRLFHERLAAGSDAASALQHARGVLAATANYGNPHYWGAFSLFGGVSPAARGEPPAAPTRWPFFLAVGCLIALGLWLLLPRKQVVVGGR